ncbi:MAG: hypothetical protein H0T89_16510 [Deltaproteobacteria bacterium]|nr:hypothetical protein [Deltaproteobacteria bacterium]MDQ3299439.1 hypothetical protein [Myxococcota bacterium]
MIRSVLLVLACTILSSVVFAQTAVAPAPGEPKHFLHADHAKRGVDVGTCETCHRIDPSGKILAPAAQGHAPCLQAQCHASDFLAVGTSEKTRKTGPAFDKASAFCRGCHEKVPWPWKKASTRVLPSFTASREYHVELDHFAHAVKANDKGTSCRGCHVVDNTSFALAVGAPGHAQCVSCHNAKDFKDFTMGQCGLCHQAPSREAYFKQQLTERGISKRPSRPATRVRACGGEVHTQLAKKNPKTPCFKHERIEHRTETGKADGAPLQCAKCHYLVADKALGKNYQSLVDLRVRPIIDNDKDRQHASCGRSGCHHESQVKAATCAESFCHADVSVY